MLPYFQLNIFTSLGLISLYNDNNLALRLISLFNHLCRNIHNLFYKYICTLVVLIYRHFIWERLHTFILRIRSSEYIFIELIWFRPYTASHVCVYFV
jgi:hypothetical protein